MVEDTQAVEEKWLKEVRYASIVVVWTQISVEVRLRDFIVHALQQTSCIMVRLIILATLFD
jgi:hypothetical protein